jgi:hypothetical protein
MRDHILRSYFNEQQKVRAASRTLQGDAARWWSSYSYTPTPWDSFKSQLREEYSHKKLLMLLKVKLYGEIQDLNEDVTVFLRYRQRLALRLFHPVEKDIIIQTLFVTLHPSINCHLQRGVYKTVEQLIKHADYVQDNLEALQRLETEASRGPPKTLQGPLTQRARISTSAQTSRRRAPPIPPKDKTDKTRSSAPQLPRCHFCPGRHWHRNCPNGRRSRGSYVAGQEAATVRADETNRRQ